MNIGLDGAGWRRDGVLTHADTPAQGLLFNVRMINAAFEDVLRPEIDSDALTSAFLQALPSYAASGVDAVTVGLQGGSIGYEGAVCSAFDGDGHLRSTYCGRVERIIAECDRLGMAILVSGFYRRQDHNLRDAAAVSRGALEAARWLAGLDHRNIVYEVINEFGHPGFSHELLRVAAAVADLVAEVKEASPGLLVSASRQGHRGIASEVIQAGDFTTLHLNQIPFDGRDDLLFEAKSFGKPVLINEDAKLGAEGAEALRLCMDRGVSWGYMNVEVNQHWPLQFQGPEDDPDVYAAFAAFAKSSLMKDRKGR